jgi:hypothetical protein
MLKGAAARLTARGGVGACPPGAMMKFNFLTWIAEYPPRADESAMGAMNRPLRGSRGMAKSSLCRGYDLTCGASGTPLAGVPVFVTRLLFDKTQTNGLT